MTTHYAKTAHTKTEAGTVSRLTRALILLQTARVQVLPILRLVPVVAAKSLPVVVLLLVVLRVAYQVHQEAGTALEVHVK
jgi:hypothetical protein|tara:strand:+ start:376 stop:615 length:240 start_codon:yes stop_codon:yes gene_type:complete